MSTREYITMLNHTRGSGGATRLVAGTRSRIYYNTGEDSNWRIILDGKGGAAPDSPVPEVRWKCAQVGNITVFTNGVDRPYWFAFEQDRDAEPVDDLIAMSITSARVISSWRGVMFLANTVTEGEIQQNRIYWSDFNDPLSWVPAPDSIASYVDLGADERVMAMAPLGGQFRVYTDKAIYDVNMVGGEEVFNFSEIYRGPLSIQFPNSLCVIGGMHIYAGEDSLYAMRESDRIPMRPDWLWRASGAIYNGLPQHLIEGVPSTSLTAFGKISRQYCHALVSGHDPSAGLTWFSWASTEDFDGIPSHSLVLQVDQGRACYVDNGFTAFASHVPSYPMSTRAWLAMIGACKPTPLTKEGNPFSDFVQDHSLTCVHDATETSTAELDDASLCVKLSDEELYPDCKACGDGSVFVMADATDKCLKQYEPDFFGREVCTLSDGDSTGLAWTATDHPTTSGVYENQGYVSIAQTDSLDGGSPRDKTVLCAHVEYDSKDVPDNTAARLHFHVGYGSQPRSLVWDTGQASRQIDRISASDSTEHKTNKTRPDAKATYQFFRTGSQLAFRLMIADSLGNKVTGGECRLNQMHVRIRQSHRDYR